MNRRPLLRYCGLLFIGAIAGCLDGTGSDTPSNESADEEEPFETTFDVRSVECGTGEDRAEITVADEIVIEGAIVGQNGCYTADLADVTIEDDGLLAEIESSEDADDELCTQCLTDVEYEARIDFDMSDSERIVVAHDGSKVEELDTD